MVLIASSPSLDYNQVPILMHVLVVIVIRDGQEFRGVVIVLELYSVEQI